MKASQTKESKKFIITTGVKQGQVKHMDFTHGPDNNINSAKHKITEKRERR